MQGSAIDIGPPKNLDPFQRGRLIHAGETHSKPNVFILGIILSRQNSPHPGVFDKTGKQFNVTIGPIFVSGLTIEPRCGDYWTTGPIYTPSGPTYVRPKNNRLTPR